MEKFDFERLEVYQRAVKFANEVYRLTSQFPKSEQTNSDHELCYRECVE